LAAVVAVAAFAAGMPFAAGKVNCPLAPMASIVYDKLEPAGFIEQSGAQDETEYYLPIGLKRLVQSAISFLVTGRQMIVTSWTKEGGDNVLDKNGGSLSILMMVLDRIGHPQYLADPGKLIKSRKSFLPMNRALTATYASLRIHRLSQLVILWNTKQDAKIGVPKTGRSNKTQSTRLNSLVVTQPVCCDVKQPFLLEHTYNSTVLVHQTMH
jgi:hypothetical protein